VRFAKASRTNTTLNHVALLFSSISFPDLRPRQDHPDGLPTVWHNILPMALPACGSFQSYEQDRLPGGLVVGAVVNAEGRSALKPYQRWRYADQVASHILAVNPGLSGHVDSYSQ